jgi:hypothetical protein
MASPSVPARPPLQLHATTHAARAFTVAAQAGELRPRTSMGDQLFVRQQLLAVRSHVPVDQLDDFDSRAAEIIELAFYSGIAVALAYCTRSDRDIGDALVRLAVQPGAPSSRSASSTIRPSGPRT